MPLFIVFIIIASSLTLSGCFSSPSNSGNTKDQTLKILWEYAYDLDGGAPRVLPLIHEDKILTSGDIKVTALDYETGEQIWKTPFVNTRQLTNRSFGSDGQQLVGSVTGKMISWNLDTGDPLWEVHFLDRVSLRNLGGIVYAENQFFAVGDYLEFHRISITGNRHTIELDARSYETIVVHNVLYVTQRLNNKGFFSAYDVQTMNRLWRFDPGEYGFGTHAPPIVDNGVVYVGTAGGPADSQNGFFALNGATGKEIWRREGIQSYSAVLEGDFIYVYDGGGVHKFRKDNGSTVWHTNFGSSGAAPIAFGYGFVYAPHSGSMRILDAGTGEIVHTMSPPDGSYFWLVTADKGRIFAQTNRHLYAFAPWGHEEALE